MDPSDRPFFRKPGFRTMILKGLFLYALVPFVLLWVLAEPIRSAVRASDVSAWWILLAAMAAVLLNWGIYRLLRMKRPSLLVFSHGIGCAAIVGIIQYEAIPAYERLASSLAVVIGCLALVFLYILGFWFASRRSRPAHTIAVGLWIAIGVIGVFMFYQVYRDFESRLVSTDTWITVAILALLVVSAFERKIRSSILLSSTRRRSSGLAAGRIVQLIGETRLDRDDDLVTEYIARVQYAVDNTPYETRAPITKFTMRRFGREAFIGREIPVHYDPDDPAAAYADRIDRHFFDRLPEKDGDPSGEKDPSVKSEPEDTDS